ncbi:Uncharacterised protein [Chlamydia trachomatis]|nr:Uncharacterised protein [Chlamydia trachomatis]
MLKLLVFARIGHTLYIFHSHNLVVNRFVIFIFYIITSFILDRFLLVCRISSQINIDSDIIFQIRSQLSCIQNNSCKNSHQSQSNCNRSNRRNGHPTISLKTLQRLYKMSKKSSNHRNRILLLLHHALHDHLQWQ